MIGKRGGMRRIVQLFIILGSLGAPCATALAEVVPPPVDIPQKLSLDEALAIFRAKSFDLLIAEANVRSVEGDQKIASAIPNLQANVGYGRVLNYDAVAQCGGDGSGCSPNQWTVGLSDNSAIEDSLSGKRQLRVDVAKNALQAAKLGRADAQRTLEFQVKQAYVQMVLAQQALDFAGEVAKSNQTTLDLNKRRYAAGAIDEGDLARVETAKLEADQAVDTATLSLRQARVALAFLLGVRGRVPEFGVDHDTLKYRVPGALQNSTPEALLRQAFETRPDLRALGYQKQRAQALDRPRQAPGVPRHRALRRTTRRPASASAAIQPPTLTSGSPATCPSSTSSKARSGKPRPTTTRSRSAQGRRPRRS